MNTQNNQLFAKLTKTENKILTTTVNETLALGIAQEKSFTNADLWNILRLKRSAVQRRKFA